MCTHLQISKIQNINFLIYARQLRNENYVISCNIKGQGDCVLKGETQFHILWYIDNGARQISLWVIPREIIINLPPLHAIRRWAETC